MILHLLQIDVPSGVCGFAVGFLSFLFVNIWRQRQGLNRPATSLASSSGQVESLHWNPLVERRGLGDLLSKVNHIAITVSDVGKSLSFYVDILGLQQIRRPTFDRCALVTETL